MSDLAAEYEKKRLEEYTKKLKGKLRELFQIGDIAEDLDFGMYRIVHQKRKDVEEFIETTVGRTVDEAFGSYTDAIRTGIVAEREALERLIREEIDETALGPDGILPAFLNTKKTRELNEHWKQLRSDESCVSMSDQHKAEIFAHIAEFFSRYYKDGDFLSLPRYSKQEKYAIPYNGEEVMLHWANKDQYYIKTDLWLNNYAFDAGIFKVLFEVCRADNSGNTANDKELVFVLSQSEDAVAFDHETKVLTLRFIRTKWNAEIMGEFLPEGANRGKPSKEHLRQAIVNEILSKISDNGLKVALNSPAYRNREENLTNVIQKHVNQFTTENTSDFFIHKDLQGFLSRELDFYLKNEVINLEDLGTDRELSSDDLKQYMTRARIIKQISSRIIDFLAQLEEFQKMLFEKKKFVLATDYCITLDYIPEEFYEEILINEKQILEWRSLFGAGEEEQTTLETSGRGINCEYLFAHPHLALDTKFFDSHFKERLLPKLKKFDGLTVQNLDAEIGGLMIHSENWQALNLIKEKYRENVKAIYIDPPYNTGNDEFIYKDNYQHSSWLSMIADRIKLSFELLQETGAFFCTTDDNEFCKLSLVLEDIFNKENFVASCAWQKVFARKNKALISKSHDYIPCYAKNISKWDRSLIPRNEEQISAFKNPDNDPRGPWQSVSFSVQSEDAVRRQQYRYPIKLPNGDFVNPPTGRHWNGLPDRYNELLDDNRIWFGENGSNAPREKIFLSEVQEGIVPDTWWNHKEYGNNQEAKKEILSLFGDSEPFSTPKPEKLLKQIITISTNNITDYTILDYFAGSGTTAHAVLSLNKTDGGSRKYIIIEMGDYFNTVTKPRIEKIAFASEWKDGKPVVGSTGQSHIFKYQTLEQYEDALDNIVFRQPDGTIARTLNGFSDYMLHYMLGFETTGSPCRLNTDALKKPFDYTLRIRRRKIDIDHLKCSAHKDGSNTWWDVKVDLVETFNYLLGIHVQRIAAYDENGLHYYVVNGRTRDNVTMTIIWRNSPESEAALKSDENFINETIKRIFPASTIFINGDFFVKDAEHIEPKFRELMGA